MSRPNILISGAGIAGTTLAYSLVKLGLTPTLIERAHSFRAGGYVIDFWGIGYDTAERLNLLDDLRAHGYTPQELRLIDGRSRRVSGFSAERVRVQLKNRFFSIARSDLAQVLYQRIKGSAPVMFGDSIAAIDQVADGLEVSFQQAPSRCFDLVIGSDGLHSNVRDLLWQPEEAVLKYLGYYCAAFSAEDYSPRDEDVYVCYNAPGRHVARFAVANNRTLFFFIFASDQLTAGEHRDRNSIEKIIKERYQDCGWQEMPMVLQAMHESSEELYFDSVSQVRARTWHKGRVALVGDAAYCPSLLAGHGAAMAMAGAYILAGEISKDIDYSKAFQRYEALLRPFVEAKQIAAERFGTWFAPKTRLGIVARNLITNLYAIPFLGTKLLVREFADSLTLPSYETPARHDFNPRPDGL